MILPERFVPRAFFAVSAAALLFLPAIVHGGDGEPVSRPGVLSLTLDSAVRMALEKNFAIQVEQFAPQIARERVRSELGRFDPNFEISAGRNETSRRQQFTEGERVSTRFMGQEDSVNVGLNGITPLGTEYDVGFGGQGSSDSSDEFGEEFEAAARLELTQPLLRGFGTDANLAGVRIARTDVQVSEWQLRNRIIDTITELEFVYNELHLAKESLRVAERSRHLALRLLEDNTRRAAIGVMSPLDITTARAEVAARQEGVILAQRSIQDNENFVKQLVSNDIERMLSIKLEVEPPPSHAFRANVPAGIEEALAIRPDYRQAMLEIQRRNITVALQKNRALPRLDLTGSLNLLGLGGDFGSSTARIASRDQSSWSAGAIFSIPLGNRTARGNYNAAKIEAAQSLINLQRLEQQIVVEVDNASGQIVTSRERIESTSEARKLARESLSAGEERLGAGTGTTFEVLELQKRLAEAEFAELRARADYNKAVSEYYRRTGTTLRHYRVKVE